MLLLLVVLDLVGVCQHQPAAAVIAVYVQAATLLASDEPDADDGIRTISHSKEMRFECPFRI